MAPIYIYEYEDEDGNLHRVLRTLDKPLSHITILQPMEASDYPWQSYIAYQARLIKVET